MILLLNFLFFSFGIDQRRKQFSAVRNGGVKSQKPISSRLRSVMVTRCFPVAKIVGSSPIGVACVIFVDRNLIGPRWWFYPRDSYSLLV